MHNKYGIVNGRGNYDPLSKRRVFKLPCLDPESQKWLAVIPPCQDLGIANPKSFFVCEKHWPQNLPRKKLPGGTTKPAVAPCIFDVLASGLPTLNLLLAQQNKETNNLRFSWPETGLNRLVTK